MEQIPQEHSAQTEKLRQAEMALVSELKQAWDPERLKEILRDDPFYL